MCCSIFLPFSRGEFDHYVCDFHAKRITVTDYPQGSVNSILKYKWKAVSRRSQFLNLNLAQYKREL